MRAFSLFLIVLGTANIDLSEAQFGDIASYLPPAPSCPVCPDAPECPRIPPRPACSCPDPPPPCRPPPPPKACECPLIPQGGGIIDGYNCEPIPDPSGIISVGIPTTTRRTTTTTRTTRTTRPTTTTTTTTPRRTTRSTTPRRTTTRRPTTTTAPEEHHEHHDHHDHHHHSSDPLDWLRESIPGEPGVDYPIHRWNEIPETTFSCDDKIIGIYADPGTGCQAYRFCYGEEFNAPRMISQICPNGTLFDQKIFTCNWYYHVDCSETEGYYRLNENIGAHPAMQMLESFRKKKSFS